MKATAWDDFGVKRFGLSYSLAGQAPVDVVARRERRGQAEARAGARDSPGRAEGRAGPAAVVSLLGRGFRARRQRAAHRERHVLRRSAAVRRDLPPGRAAAGRAAAAATAGPGAKRAAGPAARRAAKGDHQRDLEGDPPRDRQQADATRSPATSSRSSSRRRRPSSRPRRWPSGCRTPNRRSMSQTVLKAMEEAVEQLEGRARQPSAASRCTPALAAEQAAYQALLKLRAREHDVVRQNQRQQRRAAAQSPARSSSGSRCSSSI